MKVVNENLRTRKVIKILWAKNKNSKNISLMENRSKSSMITLLKLETEIHKKIQS